MANPQNQSVLLPKPIYEEAIEIANIHFVHVLHEKRTKNYFFVLPLQDLTLIEVIYSAKELNLDGLVFLVENIIHENSLI
jgi:hypothetical protein